MARRRAICVAYAEGKLLWVGLNFEGLSDTTSLALSWPALVPLWNALFASRLRGVGLTQKTLSAQYSELKVKRVRAGRRAGYVVAVPPDVDQTELEMKIENVAASLGISIVGLGNDEPDVPSTPGHQIKRKFSASPLTPAISNAIDCASHLLTPSSTTSHGTLSDLEDSPSISRKRLRTLTTRTKVTQSQKTAVDVPGIAFRGWSARSQGHNGGIEGFRAGLFKDFDISSIADCPDSK